MNYPNELIRGIPNDTFMEGNFPSSELFKNFNNNPERRDDYDELSINWYDDENALKLIFEQKKDNGEYQFKVGAVILSKIELDKLCKRPQLIGRLSYERRKITGNEYHGNLLLKKDTSKKIRFMLASSLAMYFERIETRK